MKGTPVFPGARFPRSGYPGPGHPGTGRKGTGYPRPEYPRSGYYGSGLSGLARLAVAAAALACVTAVAGCSSSGSSSSGSRPPRPRSRSRPPPRPPPRAHRVAGPRSPAVTGPAACPTSSLRVAQGVGQGYAGGVYQIIDFTNTWGSAARCGYPGVSLVSGPPYSQIGLAAKRTAGTPAKQVTLAPGATANAQVQIVDALNYPSTACGIGQGVGLEDYFTNPTVPVYCPAPRTAAARPSRPLFVSPGKSRLRAARPETGRARPPPRGGLWRR